MANGVAKKLSDVGIHSATMAKKLGTDCNLQCRRRVPAQRARLAARTARFRILRSAVGKRAAPSVHKRVASESTLKQLRREVAGVAFSDSQFRSARVAFLWRSPLRIDTTLEAQRNPLA